MENILALVFLLLLVVLLYLNNTATKLGIQVINLEERVKALEKKLNDEQ